MIELNLETVRQIRSAGVRAVYGDAAQRETLIEAGTDSVSLVLSSSESRNAAAIVQQAREMNPGLRILARANYMREVAALRQSGAAEVFTGEGEVALALIEAVLRPLGATAEQVDRERDRFRAEIAESIAPQSGQQPAIDSTPTNTVTEEKEQALLKEAVGDSSQSLPDNNADRNHSVQSEPENPP